jgi:2-iminobutanoate/2-iminopropanoate deaminase
VADPRIIPDPPFAWAEGAPYSQAIRVGDLVFTSGQGGFDAEGELVEGIEAQLRLALANLGASLEAAGASLATLVKITVYLADPPHHNVLRADVLKPPFPATTAVSTALLFDGMLCEIDAVAVVG